jgi:hypothetical protein
MLDMIAPEYRIGFRVLSQEIGLIASLRLVIPAFLRSLTAHPPVKQASTEHEAAKAQIKKHFYLLALLYQALQERHGAARTNEVMRQMLMAGGPVFFRGFIPLGPEDGLSTFVQIYTEFERQNIVFDVVEETGSRFEIVIRRCLVYEAFQELGIGELTRWMCDIAFTYFSNYHPRLRYTKDRMIARGDLTCHEVFTWE